MTAPPDGMAGEPGLLLGEAAPVAARRIALARLDQLEQAHAAFEQDDADGLHALRVGVRRLRTWLRAYRPVLDDTVGRKSRRRLRRLAGGTSAARNAEVALQWLAGDAMDGLPAGAKRGHRYLVDRLEAERDAADREARRVIENDLADLLHRLRGEVSVYTRTIASPGMQAGSGGDPLAWMAASVLRAAVRRLRRALDRVTDDQAARPVHRARIAAKRLRYLMEPFAAEPAVAGAVTRLQALQDVTGEYRDGRSAGALVARELALVAGDDARERLSALLASASDADQPHEWHRVQRYRRGLVEVARRALARERDAFAAFARDWLGEGDGDAAGGGAARLVAEVTAIADAWDATGR